MLFQAGSDLAQLLVHARHDLLQFKDWDRSANAGHYILALRVHQELAVELLHTSGGVASETHTRSAGITEIPEHHGLHIDRSAQHIVDVVDPTIVLCAVVLPGAEHRITRHDELLVRVLGEVALGVLLDDFFILLNHFLQGLGVEIGVELGFFLLLLGIEHLIESRLRNFQHHAAEHLNETAVGIGRKTRVVAAFRQRRDALIVETEIEDSVHHPRHGKFRA